MTRRTFVSTLAIAASATASSAGVKLTSLPPGAVQPEPAVGPDGRLHLVYLRGEPGAADVFYMHGASVDRFSAPMRVNSNASCAVAAGTIRGAHLALGAAGRPHVVWNGSGQALPAPPVPPGVDPATVKHRSPLLYSRLGEGGKAFEPQRNLMTRSYTLDGGGSVAADAEGHVYAGWHAHVGGEPKGEEGRRVWLARSNDSGASFSDETAVFGENQGACACCGLRFFAAADGTVYGAYRSARETVHRDLFLLRSTDHGRTFSGAKVQEWEIGACPMSSMSFAEQDGRVWVAWETDGQVWFT
ncbi:MAG: exo-alpha-sialidase, partial [Acidobacteria bacterium]|nr:exo-alpha-sialidase [Acidobacteriota bacterium]